MSDYESNHNLVHTCRPACGPTVSSNGSRLDKEKKNKSKKKIAGYAIEETSRASPLLLTFGPLTKRQLVQRFSGRRGEFTAHGHHLFMAAFFMKGKINGLPFKRDDRP